MARVKSSKPQLPSLETGPLPLSTLREEARRHLVEIVDQKRGRKALVLDPCLSSPLSLLDGSLAELLAEHGVAKVCHLNSKRLDDPAHNSVEPRLLDIRGVIYIVRSTIENAQMIATQVKSCPKGSPHDFSVYFVPRRTIVCDKVLEEEGVLSDVVIGEYPLELFPVEDDVLSLEMEDAFKECVADGDSTSLFYLARAVMQLQGMFGFIPRVQGKGPAAVAVRDMCVRMRRESPHMTPVTGSKFDRMILIDREVDLVTPMMTQITYEGLIDEITGIRNGAVPWQAKDKKAEDVGGEFSRSAKGSTLLNSSDPFYKEFRDLPYHIAIQRLQQYAREARKEYTELGNKDLGELKTFVKGLPKLAALDRLSDIATPVADQALDVKHPVFHEKLKREMDCVEQYDIDGTVAFVEELIYRGADFLEVLRLTVLLCACHGGLPRRHLDSLRQEVLHSYGHQYLHTFKAIEKAGLLKTATAATKTAFGNIRKALNLSVPDEDPAISGANPTDVAYLYKGYAPLSIRLVEAALGTGWSPLSEALLGLPGSHFDILQTVDSNGLPTERAYRPSSTAAQQPPAGLAASSSASGYASPAPGSGGRTPPHQQQETVLVVFIGGVTFAEISALRFLSSLPDSRHKFLVLTTKIVNGRTLLQTFTSPLMTQVATCIGLQP